LSKNTSPGKERNHISICEPCPKKSSGQTIWCLSWWLDPRPTLVLTLSTL
jgi:hypothetical protein